MFRRSLFVLFRLTIVLSAFLQFRDSDYPFGFFKLFFKYWFTSPHSRLITGFVTRLTRRVPLVEQELLTLLEHLSSPPVFSGVRVTRSLVLYVCFVDRCLSFCTFSFGHCVVCSSSIYGFWLPLWYLQTLLWTVTTFCQVQKDQTNVHNSGILCMNYTHKRANKIYVLLFIAHFH